MTDDMIDRARTMADANSTVADRLWAEALLAEHDRAEYLRAALNTAEKELLGQAEQAEQAERERDSAFRQVDELLVKLNRFYGRTELLRKAEAEIERLIEAMAHREGRGPNWSNDIVCECGETFKSRCEWAFHAMRSVTAALEEQSPPWCPLCGSYIRGVYGPACNGPKGFHEWHRE